METGDGLAALGVPDLQCHFTGLVADEMAGLLYSVGYYLFEKGDVIEDGPTREGLAGRGWVCLHEQALVGPNRLVLDINPGAPYGAGGRAAG